MKNLFYFMSLAFTMLFAACSSDDGPFETEETLPFTLDMKIIGVGLPGNESTRLHMNELTEMVWISGDCLDVYGYVGDVCSAPSVFELVGGEGTPKGIFSGKSVSSWDKFEVAYKGANVTYSPDVEHTYPGYNYLHQTQTAMNSFEHIKDHLLLRSGKVSEDMTNQIIQLKPQCGILKLNVRNLPDVIKDADVFDLTFYLTNPPKSWLRNAKLHLTGKFVPDADNFVYFAFEPGHDLNPGGELSIGFDVAGKEYKASVTSEAGKNYESGRIYTVTMDYKKPGPWTWHMPEP